MKSVEKRALEAFNQNKDYFQMMRRWHSKRADGARLESEVEDLLVRYARGKVLDAGCGEGALIKWILKHVHPKEVYGVDASKIGVQMAQRSVKNKRAHFRQSNLKALPFPPGFFDFIVCHSVLEHVVDYPKALKEFFRVLKPGGKLLIRLGNEHGLAKPQFLLNCLLGRNKTHPENPKLKLRKGCFEDHMSNFDVNVIPSDVLLQDVKKAGFDTMYFSTGFKSYVQLPDFKKEPWIKKSVIRFLARFPVFPFNHLGGLILILGEKPCE